MIINTIIIIVVNGQSVTPAVVTDQAPEKPPEPIWARCPDCGWHKPYSNPDSAARGLNAHRAWHKGDINTLFDDVVGPPAASDPDEEFGSFFAKLEKNVRKRGLIS